MSDLREALIEHVAKRHYEHGLGGIWLADGEEVDPTNMTSQAAEGEKAQFRAYARELLRDAPLPAPVPAQVEITDEERGFVETALQAVDAGNAGHWPTVAGYLADEVRRLRAAVSERPDEYDLAERFWEACWPTLAACESECGLCKPCVTKWAVGWTLAALSNPALVAKAEEDGPWKWTTAAALPLLVPRPLLDRKAVQYLLMNFRDGTLRDSVSGPPGSASDRLAATVDQFMDLVRPMPTEDEIATRIADPGAFLSRGDDYREPIHRWSARAVLSLLGGEL